MHHEHGNTYRLNVSGVLRRTELDRTQDVLLTEMEHRGHTGMRLLVVLDDFEGWDTQSAWSDLTFFATHGDRIERIAIVGGERWREYSLMFAAADLRKGPVEFFTPDAAADAREWLAR